MRVGISSTARETPCSTRLWTVYIVKSTLRVVCFVLVRILCDARSVVVVLDCKCEETRIARPPAYGARCSSRLRAVSSSGLTKDLFFLLRSRPQGSGSLSLLTL